MAAKGTDMINIESSPRVIDIYPRDRMGGDASISE